MWNKELTDLLEGTGDAVFVVDSDGVICGWNRGAELLLGFERLHVMGLRCPAIVQGQSAAGSAVCETPCHVLRCAVKGQAVSCFDMNVRTRSKGRAWVTTSILRLRDSRGVNDRVLHILLDRSHARQRDELTTTLIRVAREIVELPSLNAPSPPVLPLTARDKEVLSLLSEGHSPAGIASRLKISAQTLRNRLSQINEKLHTHSRLEAIAQARLRGII